MTFLAYLPLILLWLLAVVGLWFAAAITIWILRGGWPDKPLIDSQPNPSPSAPPRRVQA